MPTRQSNEKEESLDPRLQAFLDRLKPNHRMVVLLRNLENFTAKDVAEILEVPVSTVNYRQRTGLRQLTSMAEREGLDWLVRSALEGKEVVYESRTENSAISLTLVDPVLLEAIAKNPKLLKSLDWRTFEKLLARILETLGYEIELQRGTKDGGVDLFALKKDSIIGPHRYLLQAKRWAGSVGVEPVREILFLHTDYRVTKSCLATTSRFTEGAWEYARSYKWWLELKDFERLQEWVGLAVKSSGT